MNTVHVEDGRMRPLDHLAAAAIALGSYVLLFINYWLPPEKIFDETYFPRAGEEYLTRNYIYENTHPPLSKLLITFSMWLFGGMHGAGDTAVGWRFLNVLSGALVVWLLYVLAKRITKSTLFATYATLLFAFDGMHFVQSRIATPESFVVLFALAAIYTFYRYWNAERDDAPARRRLSPWLAGAACTIAGMALAFVRFSGDTLASRVIVGAIAAAGLFVTYCAIYRVRDRGPVWLWLFALSSAALVSSKWYGVMTVGVACAIAAANYRRLNLALFFSTLIFVVGTVYFACYTPQFIGLKDLPEQPPRAYTLSDVVTMQTNAFLYHDHLTATHPYSSKFWQWPLDARPILYYARYGGTAPNATAAMIYTLPNPLILWPGLLSVPLVAYLAWTRRRRDYALIILMYLAQWLPWAFSPRIAFAYHFYVDIPLICICNAIAIQWLLERSPDPATKKAIRSGALLYVVVTGVTFCYFYPILAGIPIPYDQWQQRMWLHNLWI